MGEIATLISIFFSFGSIIFGLVAWIFGVLAITCKRVRRSHCFSVCSFSACALALVIQFFEIALRAQIGDYAAIEDTVKAVIFAALFLALTTVLLNVIALIRSGKKI